ncbi:MAG TPA: cyclase family protein [Actinomycetota bacterium]|nr:cyclase family protein [Actinomycetota bacterium]
MAVPSEDEVLTYFDTLSNWGRWGTDDQLGTLNLVTPAKRMAATQLVRVGTTVSCAWDVGGQNAITYQGAVQRLMLQTGQGIDDAHRVVQPDRRGRSAGAGEYLGIVYHGYTVTHVDGLCHIFWDGKMYNDKPAELVTASWGATHQDIAVLRDGVQTRGVLLDIAALRDVPWLEPGDAVFPSDLEEAEHRAGVRVDEGDVLLLRTGYGRKRHQHGPDDVASVGRAGWHASCLPWLHERGVAMIACDTAQDAIPSGYPNLRDPIHAIGIVAMGLWLIDNCDLEALGQSCESLGRSEFLFTLAPLRWIGATGSPANPIATF